MPPLLRCLLILFLNAAMVRELPAGRVTRRLIVTGVLTGCILVGLLLDDGILLCFL